MTTTGIAASPVGNPDEFVQLIDFIEFFIAEKTGKPFRPPPSLDFGTEADEFFTKLSTENVHN